MENRILMNLKLFSERELRENILPFWIKHTVDTCKGGFYGYLSNNRTVKPAHNKASVLNSRILWTLSAAYRLYKEQQYLEIAERAFRYIREHFIDPEYSGVYWHVDSDGNPADTKKQIYAIAFAIYGLSEYYRASGDRTAMTLAIEQFVSLECWARDKQYGGYLEACSRDWSHLDNMSLSPKDMNVAKSMNTHLHVLEAYTNLLRVWDSTLLRKCLKELLEVMIERIVDPTSWSFRLFFDMDWTIHSGIISYGHDIEGSWLLYEAAEILGEEALLKKCKEISLRMADSVLKYGMDPVYGGIYNERHETSLDDGKDWWPQAEAIVGMFNAYQLSGKSDYLEAVQKTWSFVDRYIIDKIDGEWFYGVTRDGTEVTCDEKVGPWKCPYHNSRMCLEMISRLDKMIER